MRSTALRQTCKAAFVLMSPFLVWYKQGALHSKKRVWMTLFHMFQCFTCFSGEAMQYCIRKEKKGCSDSTTPIMSSFVWNNNKWYQQFTALKSLYPKILCLLFKDKYCRWFAVSIKRPPSVQGMLTAPCSRGAGLIRETFCQSAVLKMFLCYIYCLIERITLGHSTN